MNQESGFTLIELIVFIIIIGVIATGLFLAFNVSLEKQPDMQATEIANHLARQRMDIILGQRSMLGFSSYADPCPGPAICNSVPGYAVSSSIQNNWGGNTAYNIISVTVSGKANANLQTVVANY